MTGYSKIPLIQKLGIKANMIVVFLHTPDGYENLLGSLPKQVHVNHQLLPSVDFIHFFTRSQEALQEQFPALKKALNKNGMLWISWPKGACRVGLTNLNENIVRQIGLGNGLVDVKVIAVDEEWSGLKFVYRIKDRK